MEAPVKLCCGQSHWSVQCPDGLVMCCLCFSRFPVAELADDGEGKIDVCRLCDAADKAAFMRKNK